MPQSSPSFTPSFTLRPPHPLPRTSASPPSRTPSHPSDFSAKGPEEAAAVTRATSPHSSSSSVASTASSSSPSSTASSTNLVMSSVCSEARHRGEIIGGGNRLGRSAEGSVGSLATTVSPGTDAYPGDVAMEDVDETKDSRAKQDVEMVDAEPSESTMCRTETGGGSGINLSSLTIQQQEEDDDAGASGGGGERTAKEQEHDPEHDADLQCGRSRRPVAVSTDSAVALGVSERTGTGKEADEYKSGKRKAARIGSFDTGNTPSTADISGPSSVPTSVASVEPNISTASANHVDIVSYPSNDLLRLLASLLEQIATANDARNARVAAAASVNPPASSPGTVNASPSGSAPPSIPSTRRNSLLNKSEDEALAQGRFDAAPLNSPVTPHHVRRFTKIGGSGGPGILDNAFETSGAGEEPPPEREEMPLTPGVDLLREVGQGGGVEGFMPSLGGTHQPMPLSRRRGSSFIRNKRPDENATRPSSIRQSSGPTPSFQLPSNSSSPSSSTDSSPAPTRPSSATPQGVSPPSSSPPNPFSSRTSPSEPPLTSLFSASSVALSSPNATLCFHARNVPAISIEAYLLRILKYCPTTNEVFLALLVYFDRMARIGLEAQRLGLPREGPVAGQDAEGEGANSASQASKLFAIDSFNVHRLIIAGVTVASKFFSDVFYTNSRYAKVGGLPLQELNQLELQFLLLNDFRLKVPTDELQRYADQLILFWIGRNGTSNLPAAAAAKAAAASSASRPSSPAPIATSQAQETAPASKPRIPTPTHAPSPSSSVQPQVRLTHSAVAAHYPIDPRTPTMSSASISTSKFNSQNRPQSIRSQPSSSGTSVTSTITPGTPSTTRGDSSDSDSDGGHYNDGWSSREISPERSGADREDSTART